VVVNDAATLPASLAAESRYGRFELRLAGPPDETGPLPRAPVVLFGSGDWRSRTEDRPPPPALALGDRLVFRPASDDDHDGAEALAAVVVRRSVLSHRLVEIEFDRAGTVFWSGLYRCGRPVQYSYLRGLLSLGDVQTPFGARPWAVEMPSAGRSLTLPVLRALRDRGVAVASLRHAAGLSSTGDPALDAVLPLPEASDIPVETAEAILAARAGGGRVVAVGTTVVRALEGRAAEASEGEPAGVRAGSGRPSVRPGLGTTALRLGPGRPLRVVDGLLTGLHAPGESHFELLQAFAPRRHLERAHAVARAGRYLGHEFGDASLILAA
jgi:S-adenosylmethionine:tRNA ribosyltransferase-isomerase